MVNSYQEGFHGGKLTFEISLAPGISAPKQRCFFPQIFQLRSGGMPPTLGSLCWSQVSGQISQGRWESRLVWTQHPPVLRSMLGPAKSGGRIPVLLPHIPEIQPEVDSANAARPSLHCG